LVDGENPVSPVNLGEDTRARIVSVARQLFAENGYADTSINDLVNAAGVTRGALYHHFKDKTALFAEVFTEVARETLGRILQATSEGADLWERLRNGREAWLDTCTEPETYRIMLIDGRSVLDAKSRRAILASIGSVEANLIRSAIELLVQSGELPPGIRIESAATLLTGVFDAASIAIAEAEDKLKTRKEIGETLTTLVTALRNYAATMPR
jgi:AcrR family transcriptional regulator